MIYMVTADNKTFKLRIANHNYNTYVNVIINGDAIIGLCHENNITLKLWGLSHNSYKDKHSYFDMHFINGFFRLKIIGVDQI
jgi:hypothetical protein